jgi:mRNA interferase MazF
MVVHRGEIWWASLSNPSGSGPGYRHPLVILQSDEFNRSRIHTVIAAIISSNLKLGEAPGNVLLLKKHSHLTKDSVVNVSQIVTIDKTFLEERVGRLSPEQMSELEDGLKLVLSL